MIKFGLAILAVGAVLSLDAQSAAKTPPASVAPTAALKDPGWPRVYSEGGAKLTLYQPQFDNWKDYSKLSARFAVALIPKAGARPAYGAIMVEADSRLDNSTRTVLVANFIVQDAKFPTAKDEEEAKAWTALTQKLFPNAPVTISLDRIIAYLDTSSVKPRQTEVSLEPPLILVSNQAAVLVIVDGKPIPFDIEKTGIQKIVNTNWDLFLDTKSTRYYLRNDKSWLSSSSLAGAWSPVTKLPPSFAKLPETPEYKEVKAAVAAPQAMTVVPLVLITEKPSELIVIAGEPLYKPVEGTQLMWIMNTESDLFLDNAGRAYYFLTSGRWFRTAELKSGKWEPATTSLPAEFAKIPANHPRAHILASIPGTREAEEAVLKASVPVTATLDRQSAKASVDYVGEPEFKPIEGATVTYAANTPSDVLKAGDLYYLCLDGAWFVSTTAKGPWQSADKVPDEIYSIPPASEKHNVTYVTVYESTPTTVTYGYTSGYTGLYVSYGVAVWGTGYYYPPYYYMGGMYPYYWRPPYYTYGASAWYNPATGAYARGASVYGPYGGYGRAAAYNPRTGGYAWGQAAYGPYGAAASGGFYNPRTGAWGGSYHATNGYQSWGRTAVGNGDQWVRGGHYSDSRGTVGAIQGSGGGGAIGAAGDGHSGFVARSGSGDIYAGKDGNVYKRENGQWYQNSGSGNWNSVDKPASASQQARRDQAQSSVGQPRASTQQSAGAASSGRHVFEGRSQSGSESIQNLNRESSARSRGNYNANRSAAASSSRSSGGWSSRGGGGGFSRGGGGRRR